MIVCPLEPYSGKQMDPATRTRRNFSERISLCYTALPSSGGVTQLANVHPGAAMIDTVHAEAWVERFILERQR